MSRKCTSCQHLKRPEIDRRLAAGEPVAQVARDHDMNPSSLHRHKTNCLKLGSSNQIMKAAAQGSAAIALLPSKENLSSAYVELAERRIDQIVTQARATRIARRRDLRTQLSSSDPRQSCATGGSPPARRCAGECRRTDRTSMSVAVQIAERLIQKFDHEPELKAQHRASIIGE